MMIFANRYIGIKVLVWFLEHPSTVVYINSLARILNISPASAKQFLDEYAQEGILITEPLGNTRQFTLNNDDFVVTSLKRTHLLARLKNAGIMETGSSMITLAVYGSTAAGTYTETSDIDILVIGKESDIDRDHLVGLQNNLGKEIQLTVFSLAQWEKMKSTYDTFVRNILRDHVVIKGASL
jgi:predicted nucleotidyltransferase